MLKPWIAPSPLTPRGMPMGVELQTGRVVYFDPWLLKQLRIITGTIFLLLGQRDAGKSSLLIEIMMRMMRRQAGILRDADGNPIGVRKMSGRITTRKANLTQHVEFKPLNDHLFGNFVDLNQRGFINIFDPLMNMTEFDLLETAINICELANNNVPLRNFEPLALQVGVYRMLTQYASISSPEVLEIATRSLTKSDVEDYFERSNSQVFQLFESKLDEDPAMADQLKIMTKMPINLPEAEFKRDAAFVSSLLGRILRADFGQVFGGTNSLREILTDDLTTLNMTGLNIKARTLIEAMLWKWNTIALVNRDVDMIPGINIADEEHEGVNSLMYMRFWAQSVAKARAFTTLDLRATQFVSQITMAGSEGSEIRSLASQIGMGIGGYFIGQQPDDEQALNEVAALGLKPQDVEFTKTLRMGEFGFKVPNRPVIFFRALLTPTELAIAQTNQASESMLEFVSPMMSLEIQERVRRYGFVQAGA